MAKFNECYGVGQGLIKTMPIPLLFENAPTSSQDNYVIGQIVYTGTPGSYTFYTYTGAGVWVEFIGPSGDIISVTGTANQITATTTAGAVVLTIPSTFIAPGSIASTTTLTGGTGITATTGNIVASTGNITATLGNIAASAGSVSAATTVTAGTGITATTGNIVASTGNITSTLGSVSAATTVTGGTGVIATTGNITATNGNIVRGTAGNKDVYTSVATTTTAGANSAGTVTLTGGTATVATTAVTAASQIRLYRQGIGATGAAALGILTLGTVSAGVSFIINAVQAADATALQASDVSVIGWEIVN